MTINAAVTPALDVEDVEYLRHGGKPLLARLFTPRGQGPFPLLVELHGGTIGVESAGEAKGSTFWFIPSVDSRAVHPSPTLMTPPFSE